MARLLGRGLYFLFNRKTSSPPTILSISASAITDVSFTLSGTIVPNGAVTTIVIQYGVNTSYSDGLITIVDIPGNSNYNLNQVVSGLLPYKRYFFRVQVLNSNGVAVYINNIITLEPVELSDGNWAARYDAVYSKNVMHATNTTQVVELRDSQFDCALGDDLFANYEFDNATGWTLSAEMSISGSSMNFNNAAAGRSAYIPIVGGADVNPVFVEAEGVVVTAGSARGRVGAGANYIAGISTVALPAGDSAFEMCFISSTPYVYILNMTNPTTWSIGKFRVRKIRGRHLINPDTVRPTKALTDDFLNFTGSQRIIGYTYPTIGTVYAFVKRTSIDSDFVMRNDLTNIGQQTGNVLTLGANSALSTYYPQQLKRLALRTVTDSAGTIAKLNEWFSRDSYEIPPISNGVLSNGIWNDGAIWNDNEIPVTI